LLTLRSRVLFENLTGSQLVKKFPAFYGTRRFITTFTSDHHLPLEPDRSSPCPHIPLPEDHAPFPLRRSYQRISPGRRHMYLFRKKANFDGELSAPRSTPRLDDCPISVVRNCLFNVFAATLHIGDPSSICNPTTRHVVVTGTPLSSGR